MRPDAITRLDTELFVNVDYDGSRIYSRYLLVRAFDPTRALFTRVLSDKFNLLKSRAPRRRVSRVSVTSGTIVACR